MKAKSNMNNELEDIKVNIKIKLAALWTSFMFLYIYVDYFHLYMPGSINDILAGKMYVFDITQGALSIGLVSVTIPAVMICLSLMMPARINRWMNLVLAVIYIPYTLFNLSGLAWAHMIFGAIVEVIILLFIICLAWKWPQKNV